ncbi:MAG: hypothetical protein ACYCY5_00600 [Sulfuricella sp.]
MPLTAFFSPRQYPGSAIRAAMDWAFEQTRTRQAVICGFHSPLELKPIWKTAITAGRMAVVSASAESQRLTSERAALRNDLVAQLAENIVIVHASSNGGLAHQSELWMNKGLRVSNL